MVYTVGLPELHIETLAKIKKIGGGGGPEMTQWLRAFTALM